MVIPRGRGSIPRLSSSSSARPLKSVNRTPQARHAKRCLRRLVRFLNLEPMNYYNEHDPKAAAWLRSLIASNLIPNGTVDERSITEKIRRSRLTPTP